MTSPLRNRVFSYDLVRSIAILLVVISHVRYLMYDYLPSVLANSIIPFGDVGVGIFFVLSGYLIGGIFIKEFGFNIKINKIGLLKFWIKRWFRTIPNYLFFLCIYLMLFLLFRFHIINITYYVFWSDTYYIESISKTLLMFFFSHNLIDEKNHFMSMSWSLSVEEWFYFMIPLLVYVLNRKYCISFKRSMLLVIILIVIITPFLRFYLSETNVFQAVYQRLDQIMYGVLFAWIKFYAPKVYEFSKRFLFLKMILLITSYGLLVLLVITSNPSLVYDVIFKSVFPFLVGSIIISIENIDVSRFYRVKTIVTNISIYSYSIYLCNMLVTTFFVDYFYQFNMFHSKIGVFILFSLYLCICYFWGKYQYILFEKPVMNLRETVVRKIDSKTSVLKSFQNA